ncbi:MAG TPA: hypothetical protein ENH91_11075 [Leeuwenhoekiella sp.]|nr:hypothetical protein [Leeuwenhoekiella sp.]
MRHITLFRKLAVRPALLVIGVFSLVSCGSFQYASYDDGVYGKSTRIPAETQRQDVAQQQSTSDADAGYYSNYFSQGAEQVQQANDEGIIFTDVDSYSSTGEYDDDAVVQEESMGYNGQPAWGATYDDVIVNIYPSNNFGWGYGGFYNNFWGVGYGGYGYGGGYYGYGGFPNYYGGFGYPFYGYGGGYGYGYAGFNPYYGGFYGYNNYYRNNRYYSNYNSYAYNRGARADDRRSRRSSDLNASDNIRRSNTNYSGRRSSRSSTASSDDSRSRRTYSRNNVGVNTDRSSRSNTASSRNSIYNSNASSRRSTSRSNSYTPSRSSRSTNSYSRSTNSRSSTPARSSYSRSSSSRSSGTSGATRSSGGSSRSSGGTSRSSRGGGR